MDVCGTGGHWFSDIRPAHSSVFRHILPAGSRLTELAERAQMTKQSMAYLVEYLQEHGYVALIPDPSDGRAKLVCLTERGDAFEEAAIALSRRIEVELAGQMGMKEMAELRKHLEQLSNSLNALLSGAALTMPFDRPDGFIAE